ncbi:MAG: hypothetical protein JW850_07960 [Thermoflexales bacterium]|nr:hypothetical protein [Thermoflexales bacterium]
MSEDLSRWVAQGVIARYELTGRQIIVYLEDFTAETPVAFSYRLRARFPMRAQTPPSSTRPILLFRHIKLYLAYPCDVVQFSRAPNPDTLHRAWLDYQV